MTRRKHCKTQRSARLRCQAPRACLFLLAVLLAWDGTGVLRVGLLCALLHESGHVLVYRLLWGRWPDLQAAPWGVCLLWRGVTPSPWQELALAAAGPGVNLLACGAVLAAMDLTGCYRYLGYWFAGSNLLLAGLNLLPLPGLDGARILQSGARLLRAVAFCPRIRYNKRNTNTKGCRTWRDFPQNSKKR